MSYSTASDVVIIGAGISGLCMAINLVKMNRRDFVILEKGAGIGGTWFDNTYPGCCCDGKLRRLCDRSRPNANAIAVWSHLYSFSFHQNPCWTQLYPTQKEILAYLVSVAEHYNLYQHIRFNCEVQSCFWSDERSVWNVNVKVHGGKEMEIRSEYHLECDFLVSAVGQLNYPRYPNIAGRDDFEGRVMHSARWDWSYDYKGKRVAIVGSGESLSNSMSSCFVLSHSN